MSSDRCPNCGIAKHGGDDACPNCGWLPLRGTELRFLDEEEVVCPQCSATRPGTVPSCPQCGAEQVLESLTRDRLTFGISTMFALTTMVAVCVALTRISPILGVPAFLILGVSAFRSALLIRERKRYRYSVSLQDLGRIFAGSLLGLFIGGAVFGLTCFLGGMVVAAISMPFMGSLDYPAVVEAILAILLLVSTHVVAGFLICWKAKKLDALAAGGVVGLVFGSFTVLGCFWNYTVALPLAGLAVGSYFFPALWMSCYRGGAARVKAFTVGHSSATALLGVICFFGFNVYRIETTHFALSILLVPTLLAIVTLEKVWSWDDAFPNTISRERPSIPTRSPRVLEIDEIRFEDDAADDAKGKEHRDENERVAAVADAEQVAVRTEP